MQIKTRKQAMADGENIYFTGMICKNGHVNYRYVQSGACRGCLNADHNSIKSPTAIARETRLNVASETVKTKMSLNQIKIWVIDDDVELFKATAYAYAVMRYPTLVMSDVYPALAPTGRSSTMACHRVNCHSDDVASLREFGKSLQASRPAQFEVEHAMRLQKALSEVHIEPVPSWANRP